MLSFFLYIFIVRLSLSSIFLPCLSCYTSIFNEIINTFPYFVFFHSLFSNCLLQISLLTFSLQCLSIFFSFPHTPWIFGHSWILSLLSLFLQSRPFLLLIISSPSSHLLTLLLYHAILSLLSSRYLYFLQTLSSRQYSPYFIHSSFFFYLYLTLFSLFHFFILSPFLQLFQFSFFPSFLHCLITSTCTHLFCAFYSLSTRTHTHIHAGAHSISLLWLSTYVVFLFPLSKHSFHYSATTTPTPATRHWFLTGVRYH